MSSNPTTLSLRTPSMKQQSVGSVFTWSLLTKKGDFSESSLTNLVSPWLIQILERCMSMILQRSKSRW